MNDYDLSDKGRSTWTADQTQPGYGNFCFGHLEASFDRQLHAADPTRAQYSVTYHYGVSGLPDWANSTEMKTAFPKIRFGQLARQRIATANLVKSDNGWQVESVQPAVGHQRRRASTLI